MESNKKKNLKKYIIATISIILILMIGFIIYEIATVNNTYYIGEKNLQIPIFVYHDLVEDESDIEDIENPNKDFYVKLNVKDDIIELYDSATNKLIETISGNELGELIQKLNMASGIFVNKKV